MSFYTYILASKRNGTLYTGSTDDLARRVGEHRAKVFSGFTARYGVCTLVWFKEHPTREAAFLRERRIKKWERDWKLALIERFNPGWRDLLDEFTGCCSNPAAEGARFVSGLDARHADQEQKNLGPRLRGDEREGEGEGGGISSANAPA